jgi:hypothetical protein
MKTVTLAEFNREYHRHELFGNSFAQAFENFLDDVLAWQATIGIEFDCEVISARNEMLMANVTKVVARFESDSDYAIYKLAMPVQKVATDITGIDGKFHFTNWV